MEALRSEAAESFWQVLDLAGQLGAMDYLGLGMLDRPVTEVEVRQRLETSFDEHRRELETHMRRCDEELQERVFGR